MLIIETPIFTKRILEVLSDDEYRELQQVLVKNPKKVQLFLVEADCGKSVGRQAEEESAAVQESFTIGLFLIRPFLCYLSLRRINVQT